jgi:hypothetical protein
MPFYFLYPLYLFGLIATSIPLLIHLLNRRRLRRIRFPAVRFILLSQRRIARSYRLRHWLILALRTFAILLLALLLAHPIFQTGVGLFAGGGPSSTVVVLDNSLSMEWSEEGKGFSRAKSAVRQILSNLREGNQAALVPTNESEMRQIRFQGHKAALLKELDAIRISAGTADFTSVLSKAYDLLIKEPAAQKEIWLITDMALTGWDRFDVSSLGRYDPMIPLKIIKVGNNENTPNATIKGIKIRDQNIAAGLPIHLEAQVVNFGDEEISDLVVQLNLNNQDRDQKLVTLSPKEELRVSFQFKLSEPGNHHGFLTLKKAGVVGNPTGYFTFQAQTQLDVLVVDGDPQISLPQSESFFLARALSPGGKRNTSLFLPTVTIPEALDPTSLGSYQVLIFCNVSAIPDAVLPRLRDYVLKGGGLLLFLGNRVQKDPYNLKLFQSAPAILPSRIGEKRVLTPESGEKIAKIDTTHPALKGLGIDLLKTALKSANVTGYFRIENSGERTLLALGNGDPLLMENKMGPGRVLLFTSAADRDWSDLPLKTAYLPFIQSLVHYLAGDKGSARDTGITAGSKKTFFFPASQIGKTIRIVRPDLGEREIRLVADGQRASASFQENDLAGVYRLSLPAPQYDPRSDSHRVPPLYAVNSPFLESRLREIPADELQEKIQPINLEIIPINSLERGGTKMDLSFPLLLMVIGTLALEGWLGQRTHE